ncbi:bifunctional folylpolyglutamate synthase/dihydrofolate synthase [Ancylomarina euxinus]|uniref:Dihydrofolate synthase/folylpolyglutamate synthase n=1 Tax=Ancylomarina euxinus TaxID=2283627 RepID=A0A425Y588_9BACT|nr:folylpolyglutamate synthase/dihydrofolate synthase family protein [Ancylomarina euxinus]MCZ4694346.1 bifunctional folylpolyglutamate synthase/dihydrofolate synthase [Ancylomarina euxinus]MUP14323.1 bifunctional folylpolyglutamate synthase/dihydrofolate synthase [Ancylomarina euxinus]RRG23637.1 bifunctional folylpolyglutamate synthase/dihydrofolate synthase [Ancylomarina euxinus]
MNYQETINYLFNQLPMFQRTGKAAYKANLDTTLALDAYFEHPHHNFKCIHVAGTNGKGSVSHTLASVLQSAGYKVGLYTSPHLRDFRERVKINGEMIPENSVVDFVASHKHKFEELSPSFFEMTVALAFDYFAKEKVDIAVIEVGLGGRLDSTNIIDPILTVITNISFDHTSLLGNSIPVIAGEKAGIIKNKIPVVIGEKQDESQDVFIERARPLSAPILFAEDEFEVVSTDLYENYRHLVFKDVNLENEISLKSDLLGIYQVKNIRTALVALGQLNQMGFNLSEEIIKDGISRIVEQTSLLGRWQRLCNNPRIICDTGHNVAGVSEILKQLDSLKFENLHMVIGMVDDKEIDGILSLLPKNANYYFTKASIPRALNEEILKEKAEKFQLKGKTYKTVSDALNAAKNRAGNSDLIFVGGSTFVVAEVV